MLYNEFNSCLLYTSKIENRRNYEIKKDYFNCSINFNLGSNYTVSYTHLDVYKRQHLTMLENLNLLKKMSKKITDEKINEWIEKYNIDVYKRQNLKC